LKIREAAFDRGIGLRSATAICTSRALPSPVMLD
jgi:hypothetical protein